MKKLIAILLLTTSLIVTGCGDSENVNVNVISGLHGNPVNPNPPTPVPPVPVAQGFFVDAAAGNDATGDFTTGAPFATVQAAVAAAPEGATIVVRAGNYAGAVALKNRQRLLGAGSALITAQTTTRPILAGPVDMADGNTLDFLRIQGANGDAVVGTGQNGGTVTNCEIVSPTNNGSGINASPGTGDWTVTNNTITGVTAIGVELRTAGTGKMRARVNNNTITGSRLNAIGFLAEGSSELVAQIRDNTMTGNQANFTFEAFAVDNSVMCLDVTGNANDDVYSFALLDAAVMNVEQLSQLQSVNRSGRVVIASGGAFRAPADVADGFCGF